MRVNGDFHQFDVNMVKEYVIQRIEALNRQVQDQRLSSDFANVASLRPGGDSGAFSMLGGFIFDMMIWDALANAADAGLMNNGTIDAPVFSTTFNNAAVVCMEVYSLMSDDDNVYAIRSNGVKAFYPKGRRKMAIDPKLGRNFNRAANQNCAYASNAEAELCALMDIMKKLEGLMAAKVREITVNDGESVYGAINSLSQKARKHGGMDLLFGGLRTAI